jgi:hypothetical protein
VQVKGGAAADVSYGGIADGVWQRHQIEWLRGLNVPLYVAAIDNAFTSVRLYSTSAAYRVFFQAGTPFQVTCRLGQPAFDSDCGVAEPKSEIAERVDGSDSTHWTIDLGAPILELRLPELLDELHREKMRDAFIAWIRLDRLSQLYFQQNISYNVAPAVYRTNAFPTVLQERLFWDPTPGKPSVHIERQLAPVLTVLVQHLLGQNDLTSLREWLPALRWLDGRGNLTPMGQGAIREIQDLQVAGSEHSDTLGRLSEAG